MTDKERSVDQQVADWLKKSGYPLEMLVAREFRRAEFPVTQPAFYEDPSSKEQREIDVVASRAFHDEAHRRTVRIQFVVECKRSSGYPWVVFSGDEQRRPVHPNLMFAATNDVGNVARLTMIADENLRRLPLFIEFAASGYGMAQALKRENFDASYVAAMQACSAASVFAAESAVGRLFEEGRKDMTFAVPVIVLDGHLFDVTLAREEEVQVKQVKQHCVFIQNARITGPVGQMVYVVTKGALADFAKIARETADGWLAWCKENSAELDDRIEAFSRLAKVPANP
jgi:hypothetical protein